MAREIITQQDVEKRALCLRTVQKKIIFNREGESVDLNDFNPTYVEDQYWSNCGLIQLEEDNDRMFSTVDGEKHEVVKYESPLLVIHILELDELFPDNFVKIIKIDGDYEIVEHTFGDSFVSYEYKRGSHMIRLNIDSKQNDHRAKIIRRSNLIESDELGRIEISPRKVDLYWSDEKEELFEIEIIGGKKHILINGEIFELDIAEESNDNSMKVQIGGETISIYPVTIKTDRLMLTEQKNLQQTIIIESDEENFIFKIGNNVIDPFGINGYYVWVAIYMLKESEAKTKLLNTIVNKMKAHNVIEYQRLFAETYHEDNQPTVQVPYDDFIRDSVK